MSESEAAPALRFKKLAEQFLEKVHHTEEDPRLCHWGGSYWRWDGTLWRAESSLDMEDAIHRWAMDAEITSDPEITRKVAVCVRAMVHLYDTRSMPFWNPPYGPVMGGWWLHTRNWTIAPERIAMGKPVAECRTPKSSRWFSNVSLGYDWDPAATCPKILKFLSDRVGHDPELLALLQEYGGYLLMPESKYHAALFLVGAPGSGKSTIGELYAMMLGEDNISRLKLEDFGSEFGLISTQGKLLNYVDEGYTVNSKTEAILKWYISGSPLQVNRKYKDHTKLVPTARLIVCANQWPEFKDGSEGIWRRIKVVPMNLVVPSELRNVNILATFKDEIQGFLNWCLEGLGRLVKNGRFTDPDKSRAEIGAVRGMLQSHVAFAVEFVAPDPKGGFISSKHLFNTYKSWCGCQGLTVTTDVGGLQDAIARMYPSILRDQRGLVEGVRVRGMKGIKFKESLS